MQNLASISKGSNLSEIYKYIGSADGCSTVCGENKTSLRRAAKKPQLVSALRYTEPIRYRQTCCDDAQLYERSGKIARKKLRKTD